MDCAYCGAIGFHRNADGGAYWFGTDGQMRRFDARGELIERHKWSEGYLAGTLAESQSGTTMVYGLLDANETMFLGDGALLVRRIVGTLGIIEKFTPSGVKDSNFGSGGRITYDTSAEVGAFRRNALFHYKPGRFLLETFVTRIVGKEPVTEPSPVKIECFDLDGKRDTEFGNNGVTEFIFPKNHGVSKFHSLKRPD